MLNYFKKTIPINFKKLNYVDLTYFSEYLPKFGFRVEFGALHGAKQVKDSIY